MWSTLSCVKSARRSRDLCVTAAPAHGARRISSSESARVEQQRSRTPALGRSSVARAGLIARERLVTATSTYTLRPPGKGGISWDDQGKMISGEDGVSVDTLRFPGSLDWSSPSPAQRLDNHPQREAASGALP
ncbi:hypothetical protein WME90_39155 [Sorangium sp. So ce375]|uniref:hypothetical protein n=1 Tax=Sorangium sp. So ce375 TaxID=3133306 RepID=UPI003F5C4ACD